MMTNLFGCDKNSRAHVESQFVDLEKIYSTANVSDLFKFYPKGFEIIYTVSNFDETGKDVQYSINVSGNPIDKSVKGFIEKKLEGFLKMIQLVRLSTNTIFNILLKGGRV